MEVYPCGIPVKTKIGSHECIITAITIRFGRAVYELSYFHSGEYKSAYLDESEFVTEEDKVVVGFKTREPQPPEF